jgi:hypothetical protein
MGRQALRNFRTRARTTGEAGEGELTKLIGLLTALIGLTTAIVVAITAGWLKLPTISLPKPPSRTPAPAVIRPVGSLDGHNGRMEELLDIAAGSRVSVAVGWTDVSQANRDGSVWRIRKGEDGGWTDVSSDSEALTGPKDQELRSVAAYHNGFVAVGEEDGHAAVYVSGPTAARWSRQPLTANILRERGSQLMRGVTAHGRTLVAVGATSPSKEPRAAAWVAPDGHTWRRATLVGEDARGSAGVSQILYDVVYTKSRFVAVGRAASRSGGSLREPVIWTSRDGKAWTRIPSEAIDDPECDNEGCQNDQHMYGLVAARGYLVAVGTAGPTAKPSDCDRSGAVWTSSDASTWKRVRLPSRMGRGGVHLYSVAATKGRVVAVGGKLCKPTAAAVWISKDDHWDVAPSGGSADGRNASMAAVGFVGDSGQGIIVGSDALSRKRLA